VLSNQEVPILRSDLVLPYQSVHALAFEELRAGRQLTQEQVARALGVSQANVSQIEHQDNIYLRTLGSYIAALGGHLEVRAVFPEETVVLALPGVGPH
jgi:DNA-binding XRE family transcriptional regulator